MSNKVQIPREFSHIISNRKKLYREKEDARDNNDTLDRYSSTFKDSVTIEEEKTLSSDGTPPAEVAEVLPQLKAESDAVKNAQQSISSYNRELNETKSGCSYKIMQMFGMIIFVALIVSFVF